MDLVRESSPRKSIDGKKHLSEGSCSIQKMIGANEMIPDFLRRENKTMKVDPNVEKMGIAVERYEKHFGEGVNTESYTWPIKEWSRIVDICIKEEKTLDELLGDEHDPEADE